MTVRERYAAALKRMAELKPTIYTPKLVQANLAGASKMTERELLGFTIDLEHLIERTEART